MYFTMLLSSSNEIIHCKEHNTRHAASAGWMVVTITAWNSSPTNSVFTLVVVSQFKIGQKSIHAIKKETLTIWEVNWMRWNKTGVNAQSKYQVKKIWTKTGTWGWDMGLGYNISETDLWDQKTDQCASLVWYHQKTNTVFGCINGGRV